MAGTVETTDNMMGLEEDEEEDMWGDLEVQENIIPQLLEGGSSTSSEYASARKVRFTANSTLAVYPSEKSLSGEEGSEDEYDEDDENEEEYDEDEEYEDDGEDSSGSEGEEAFSDDDGSDNEVVINNSKDSLDSQALPFIHTGISTTAPPLFETRQPAVHPPSQSPSSSSSSSPTTASQSPPSTSPVLADSLITGPQFNNNNDSGNKKEVLHVQVEQQEITSVSPSQRRWYQQKQTYQRYTSRYSPKASPTEGSSTIAPSPSIQPSPNPLQPQEKPMLVQQLERAKLELNQEIARAKEASDNLTVSSAKLQESVSSLSDRIAVSRQLLAALGCTLRFGGAILALRLARAPLLPTSPAATAIQYHASIVLAAVLADRLIHHYLFPPIATKNQNMQSQVQQQQQQQHNHSPCSMYGVTVRATVSGVALTVGIMVAVRMWTGELKQPAWPAVKGAFFGAFTSVCEQILKSLLYARDWGKGEREAHGRAVMK